MCQHVEVGYEFSYWNEMLVFHVLGLECHIIIHPSARTSTLSHAHSHTHMPRYLHVLARKYTHSHTDTLTLTHSHSHKNKQTQTHTFLLLFLICGECVTSFTDVRSPKQQVIGLSFFFLYILGGTGQV